MKGGLIHRIAEGYKRWRHTRGYGVHSPFAYRLVTHVVRPAKHYGYYAEERLKRGATYNPAYPREVRRETREALLLMRLAVELGIRSAYVDPGCPSNFIEALKAACSTVYINPAIDNLTQTDIICSEGTSPSLQIMSSLIKSGKIKAIFMRNASDNDAETLYGNMDEGLMFRGKRTHIIIPRPGMQKLSYTLRL